MSRFSSQKAVALTTYHAGENDADVCNDARAFTEVFDHMEQGVVVWSGELICNMVNQRYYELVGLSDEDVSPGTSVDDYYKKLVSLGRIDHAEANKSIAKFKQQSHYEFERVTPQGRSVQFVGRPLSSGGLVVTLTDVTEAKEKSNEASKNLQRAELAKSQMAEMLANEKIEHDQANLYALVSDWLHSCETQQEVFEVVKQSMVDLYPDVAGEFYIYSNSRDILELAANWGDSQPVAAMRPNDCWSLRRGRAFEFGEGPVKLGCMHVAEASSAHKSQRYLCMPIIAHGDTVGLLHLDFSEYINITDAPAGTVLQFITRLAEQISLALANVRLRDELHRQSTLDSLTGMFNRRSFFDRASMLIAQLTSEASIGCVALFDVDNFKQFNDRFGHDAGDRVLIEMAKLAEEYFLSPEIISRIGGEEFALTLPELTPEQAKQRMDGFLARVSELSIFYGNGSLPPCSISAGLAVFPEHGRTIHELIKKADEAMYKAKKSGKNCVYLLPDKTK